MEESSPGCGLLGGPSPWDRGLCGDILGCSIDSGLGVSSAASWLEAKEVGEIGTSSMLTGPRSSSRLGGFIGSGVVFSAERFGGLSTFGDSLPSGALLAEVSGSIS
jgi:hypothetical protein